MQVLGSASKATAGAVAAIASLSLAVPALPAFASTPAHARAVVRSAPIRGTVVAREFARHTLVVSAANGLVKTLRLSSARETRSIAIGTRVLARSARLGDGTYHVLGLRKLGHAGKARIRGTVVRTFTSRTLLSAGGSVFAIRSGSGLRAHVVSTNSQPGTGSTVVASVDISNGAVEQTGIQQTGQTALIGLTGILSSVSSSDVVVAVESGALTTVALPPSLSLPSTVAVGDRVELLTAYASQGFSLVTIIDDTLAASSPAVSSGVTQGESTDSQSVDASGSVTSVSPTSLVVQPGDGAAAVTFAVPNTFDVSALAAGINVEAVGTMVNGVLTLSNVQVKQSDSSSGSSGDQSQSVDKSGRVTSVSPTSLVVQPGDNAAPVTFAVPSTVDVSGVVTGDKVEAVGTMLNGVLTLEDYQVKVNGSVTSVSPTSLVVQPGDNAAPVTYAVPSTVDVSALAAGVSIKAVGTTVSGVLSLQSVTVQQPGS